MSSDNLLRQAGIFLSQLDTRVLPPGLAVVSSRLKAEIDSHFEPKEVVNARLPQAKKTVTKKAKKKVAKKR